MESQKNRFAFISFGKIQLPLWFALEFLNIQYASAFWEKFEIYVYNNLLSSDSQIFSSAVDPDSMNPDPIPDPDTYT